MTNIERLAVGMKNKTNNNVMIYTIPGTSNWLIGQKIEPDKWIIHLGKPLGNVLYNLGTMTSSQFAEIWKELTKMQIETKISQLGLANHLKDVINNFIKKYAKNYKKFIKIEKIQKSQSICKMSRKHSRSKSSK